MMDDVLIRARKTCLDDDRLRALMDDRLDALDAVQITACEIEGRPLRFATDMARDPIQRAHRACTFFEPDELALMRRYLPEGGTFLDIGANVGNHSLYAGLFCAAHKIIPFEPNPPAYRLLILNLVMNGLHDRTVFDYLGFGASDLDREGFAMTPRHKNLGAARMVPGEGEIATLRPDDVLQDETPDFIKIDVEGMEMDVLRGLQKTVKRVRPVLLVEVDQGNIHDFADWRLAHGFALPASIKHYRENRNFLCVPQERLDDTPPLQAREGAARLMATRHPTPAKTVAREGGDG